jgi:hypothetical protein
MMTMAIDDDEKRKAEVRKQFDDFMATVPHVAQRYEFPPMLGPAADQPLGSFERAECFGNELDRVTEQVADAVARLAEVVKRILAEEEQILNAFGTPSLDEYLARCCGVGEMEMMAVLHASGHHDLCDRDVTDVNIEG